MSRNAKRGNRELNLNFESKLVNKLVLKLINVVSVTTFNLFKLRIVWMVFLLGLG